MRGSTVRGRILIAACAFGLLMLGFAMPAQAGAEHVVTVEVEFSGGSCSLSSTIVVSATNCDLDDIADDLESDLDAAGMSTVFCGYVPLNGNWECAYIFPSGCSQDEIAITVQPGSSCGDNSITGNASVPSGLVGDFIFDVD